MEAVAPILVVTRTTSGKRLFPAVYTTLACPLLAVRSFSAASRAPFSGESSVKVTLSLMTGTVFPSLVKLDTQTVRVRLLLGWTFAVVMTGALLVVPVPIGEVYSATN